VDRLPDPMWWLHEGVSLTLLIDLLDERGPDSEEISRSEPADLGWTRGFHAA
jgi:hypothetical protein